MKNRTRENCTSGSVRDEAGQPPHLLGHRRQFLHLAAGAAALPAISRSAEAQAYPTRPITLIVPGPAGGSTDTVGRILAERMRRSLGQPIIIENVSGAGGSIGAGRVARAKPDGYTIDLGFLGNHVLNGAVYSLQYDVLNDFAPISPLVMVTLALFARKSLPATNVNELVGWLKANPNKVSMGFSTIGFRLLSEFFQKETGTQLLLVPYRGGAPARQDLAGGQIDLLFDTMDALPLMRAGSIKAYAAVNETRLAVARDIPTFRELGLLTLSSFPAWQGFFAPKGTPTEIIGRLNAAVVSTLADEGVRSRLIELGFDVYPRERQTPEALAALVKADAERTWPIIKAAGIKPE
jgi:tripartite-type tricarboxylate transporter receptor subunit TctC